MEDGRWKNELYYRYADNIDLFLRSIGRRVEFCPEAGKMGDKTRGEIEADIGKHDNEVTMNELKKIADTIQANITTEADFPSKHPELGNKVLVLDLVLWVDDVKIYSTGMEGARFILADIQSVHVYQLAEKET